MPNYIGISIIVIAIVLLLWFIIVQFLSHRKGPALSNKVPIDLDRLLLGLGGAKNIKSMEATQMKITFIIVDSTKVSMPMIKELGATGVVQSKGKVSAIFGKASPNIVAALRRKL